MSAALLGLGALVLAAAGTPVYVLIGGLALLLFKSADIDMSAVIVELFRLATLPALIAVPLFTFAGFVLAESKAPQRMLRLGRALFGSLPGGLAVMALATTAVFTAFTGASGVTIIALGGLLRPMLLAQGYPAEFTLGLLTTTGSLGLLFPPSLPIILYGLVGKLPIGKLFAAGFVPGALILVLLAAYSVRVAGKSGLKRTPFDRAEAWAAARAAAWEIPLPFVVVGGIYGGLFTATDAAAVMAFYVLVAETLIYRDLDLLRDVPGIAVRSMMLVGAILIVLGTALGLTNYMVDAQVPARLFEALQRVVPNKTAFLVLLNAFLLVVNMVEIFSAIIIVVPIIVPVALRYGIDPIHLGVIFLLNLELGYMTPPLGLNLFLSSQRFEQPLPRLYASVLPFWLLILAALLLVTYFPPLSLGLLELVRVK